MCDLRKASLRLIIVSALAVGCWAATLSATVIKVGPLTASDLRS
jgi:hypothetical protein